MPTTTFFIFFLLIALYILTSCLGFAKFWQGSLYIFAWWFCNAHISLYISLLLLSVWLIFCRYFLRERQTSHEHQSHFDEMHYLLCFGGNLLGQSSVSAWWKNNISWPETRIENIYSTKLFQWACIRSPFSKNRWWQISCDMGKISCPSQWPKLRSTLWMPGEGRGTQDSWNKGPDHSSHSKSSALLGLIYSTTHEIKASRGMKQYNEKWSRELWSSVLQIHNSLIPADGSISDECGLLRCAIYRWRRWPKVLCSIIWQLPYNHGVRLAKFDLNKQQGQGICQRNMVLLESVYLWSPQYFIWKQLRFTEPPLNSRLGSKRFSAGIFGLMAKRKFTITL